jgi:murein L,D-transpeptidase YafK
VKNSIVILTALVVCLTAQSFKDEQDCYPRVRQARENREAAIDSLFHTHNCAYPPEEILIVAYKHERILELWIRPDTCDHFILLKQYPFTAFSGTLGPKRKRGDLQIPEGLYTITHFNPYSNFHLSMLISYPNASDRILSQYNNLGGEIRIHGSSVTIGCIPIGDAGIEELYIVCVDVKSAGQQIPVYIFPCRMHCANMKMLEDIAASDTALLAFWENMREGYRSFVQSRKKLCFSINAQGTYMISNNTPLYPWIAAYEVVNRLDKQIAPPPGYDRISVPRGSFEHWLREIPLKPGTPPVRLYNNDEKSYQDGHYKVVDIDVGNVDLQQCADAIMRLYAEYQYSCREFDEIAFLITNGDRIPFRKWIDGFRPLVRNNVVIWHKTALPDSSYTVFMMYLNFIFAYAGTYSLKQQLQPVENIQDIKIGDVFVQGGFPGHAVMVMDIAHHTQTGNKIFLLAQSFMPAQDVHLLKNLNNAGLSPWYPLDFGDTLRTPEWTFLKHDLMKW